MRMRVLWPNICECVCIFFCSASERVVWAQICSPDLLKVKAAGIFMLFIWLFFFFFCSVVCCRRKKTLLAFRTFVLCNIVVCFCPCSPLSKTESFSANVRSSQSASALTDDKSRESNALQTKYINKFCLYSAIFLWCVFFSAFYTSFCSSLGRAHRKRFMRTTGKHTSDSSFVLIHSEYVCICIVNSTCVLSTVHAIKYTICFRDKFDHTRWNILSVAFSWGRHKAYISNEGAIMKTL